MTASNLRHWLSRGELDKLENVVLEGRGSRLLGEQSPDLRTRVFLRGLPNYLTKISQIHDAVVRGSLTEVQRLIDSEPKKKLIIAKDSGGTPLIHKAVYYDHQDILEWIVDNYPIIVEQKDREGRTGLHYCAACRDPEAVWDILIEAGCDASTCDRQGNPAAYYLQKSSEIELPDPERMTSRRLRIKDPSKWTNNLDFKPSNIRIWIHNRDIGKLQQVLWEGHGSKLRCETSNNSRVKRFLEAVPFIMGTIKDIHTATVKNDIDEFRKKVEEPVSPIILRSKDSNGLNVLHKAAGFGYVELAQEILSKYPTIVNAQDNDGKTPLHYAAVCKDGGIMYDLLMEYGADDNKTDNRQKAAAFYRNRPSEIDMANLVIIPEAPRVSGTSYPRNWDWRIIETDQPLSRIKHTGNNADDDSAFSGVESSKLTEDAASTEIENAADEVNDNGLAENEENDVEDEEPDDTENPEVNDNENPEAELVENEEENKEAESDNNNNKEGEEFEKLIEEENDELKQNIEEKENVIKKEDIEEKEEDEEAVITPPAKAEDSEEASAPEKLEAAQIESEAAPEEAEAVLEQFREEEQPENEENEEKAEPSTADSGVGDTPNDEEQVIIGEPEDKTIEDNGEAIVERRGVEQQQEEGKDTDTNGMAVDEEAAELVENGNMEQLAALVLSGEGYRIVGRHSSNPELQTFIDNVPIYMAKIRAVHKAAREGNLKDLQISLDRRKFAVAKDQSSPHGATPLHVAVIFGRTPIVRYLGGRFPETVHGVDLDGRTALHYASILADNGHYYNLLLHLGANPLVQDNFGQKADYYKKNQDDLSHKQLLQDYGAPESLADEMLVDKVPGVDTVSGRRDVTEPETLATLERCFRLLTSGIGGGGGGIGLRRSSMPMTPTGSRNSTSGILLGRCLRRSVFEAIKHRVTCMDHNLFDVIWPALKKYSNAYASNNSLDDSNINVRERRLSISSYDEDFTGNVVAPDFESYIVFAELLDPLIRNLHCVTATGELPEQPPTRFFQNNGQRPVSGDRKILETRDLDSSGRYIMAGIVECTRNLDEHQLPLTMRINELENIERTVTNALMGPELRSILIEGSNEDEPGTYFTVSELLDPFSEIRMRMAASGLLFPLTESENTDERRLHGKHWPYGRGVFVNSTGDLAVWVNMQDHVRVICCTSESKPGQLGKAYVKLGRFINIFDGMFNCKRDLKLGYLTSRPCAIGNTVRFELVVKLVGLAHRPEDLKHLCVVRGLRIQPTLRMDTVRLGNQQSLSIDELQTYQDFDRAVINVLTLEKEMALTSSLKIATVIAKIFKKRRLSGPRTIRT